MVDETSPLVATKSSSQPDKPLSLWGYSVSRWLQACFCGSTTSLSKKAWEHFEYYTLPRRKVHANGRVSKASPGDNDSSLYSAWRTPQRDLKDFGTGVAVYFETLRALAVICFLAALLYIPTIRYYGSDDFSADDNFILQGPLRGSLICAEHVWVPCVDCTLKEWKFSPHRIGRTEDGLVFVLKNNCLPLKWPQGLNHLLVMSFLTVAMFALGYRQLQLQLRYDESVLTASDFSIQVDNPPANAVDPDEWKRFFAQFGDVAFVTVALNNSNLLQALKRRRVLLQKTQFRTLQESEMSYSTDSNKQDASTPMYNIPANLQERKPLLYKRLIGNETKCKQLLQQEFPTSAAFVTFQTEQAQRNALKSLSVGKINVTNNNINALKESHRFRGNLLLDVFEAPEPSDIRWQDLDETFDRKIAERLLSGLLTLFIIVGGFCLVDQAYEENVSTAAIVITVLNMLGPHLFKAVNALESHQKEASYQASLYWKISVFRWVNTAVVTILVKPFTQTLSESKSGLVASVQAVLRAEILIPTVLKMCDLVGNVKRHVLAPRALNQAAMSSYFRGSKQNLGEKYTNCTKTVFLVFFYSSIFPSGLFYGAVALALNYATDKFNLMRSWAPMPEMGNDVATLSRKVFFPLTIAALAVASLVFYSEYPCDNLCETDSAISHSTWNSFGTHIVTPMGGAGVDTPVSVSDGDMIYRFCQQDILENFGGVQNFFFGEKDDWMGGDQEFIVYAFGLFAVVVMAGMVLVNMYEDINIARLQALGGYETVERDSGEIYSDQELIKAYVPQCIDRNFAFPLIASDLSNFNGKFVGWNDPILGYEFYNLQKDVDALGYSGGKPVLSTVKQYC